MTNRPPEAAPVTTDDAPEMLSMSEAARLIGKLTNGRSPHIATLHRWAAQGVTSPGARRVFLETLKFGRRRVTTREAVMRFASELAAPAVPPTDGPLDRCASQQHPTRSTGARRARVERALAALREM